MQTLHEGFAGRPKRRFLPTVWRQQSTFEPQVLPGVIVHVMGPSRSKEVIRDMNPPAGESYLRLVDTGNGDPDAVPYPFSSDWSIPRDLLSSINPLLQLSPADESDLQKVGKGMEQALTVALDAAINGTSLMLMMKVGQAYLLLPGDAQWGTWRAALDDPEWRPLLAKTTFYKVGHHGSHNATPIEFVDRTVGKDFWAMVSVKPTAKWKSIPKEELLTALRKRTKKLVRSDGVKPATATAFRVEDFFVEAEIPTRVTRA